MAKGINKKAAKVSAKDQQVHVSNRKVNGFQKTIMIVIVGAFIVSTLLTGLAGMGAF